jgi:hypothetical protein
MIAAACFQRDWITRQAQAIGSRNPVMLEKAIVALQLLANLVESGLPIQFKGGTSLLLRLDPPRRLSIDIDIVTQATSAELTAVLETISRQSPFDGYEHDTERDRDLPPKQHFRVFYPSVIEPKRDHVLLDVLFEPEASPHCEPVSIATSFITPERDVRVHVPSVNSLLGDKLTAFAPRTIGILHHERRRTDIVKQLFDVAALFDAATDLSVVADVYATIHARQLIYRQANYTLEETLNDTIESAFFYTQIGLKGGVETPAGLAIAQGVTNLRNHLVNQPFSTDEARLAAAKAACTAAWIQKRPELTLDDLRFDPTQVHQLRSQQIPAPWSPLNRLKGANPEAFHLWFQAHRLLSL